MRRVRIYQTLYKRILSCSGKRITRYAFVIAAAAVITGCRQDGRKVDTPVAPSSTHRTAVVKCDAYEDTNPVQLKACENLLDKCAEYGILDKKGVKVYKRIKQHPSVSLYMELIGECERERNFDDTVAETDAWADYFDCVLSPRGVYCFD